MPDKEATGSLISCELAKPCAFNQDVKTAAHGTLKINSDDLSVISFALPSLSTPLATVAEIEAEQALVAANRELITRFEKKIQATLARVWGEDATYAAKSESVEFAA